MDPFSTRFHSLAGRARDLSARAWPSERARLEELAAELDRLGRDLERAGLLEPDHQALRRPQDGHGTEAGYKAHWRRNEEACAPCRAAHVTYTTRRAS